MAMINQQLITLAELLEAVLTKEELSRRFTPMIKLFIEKNRTFLKDEGIDASILDAKTGSVTKTILARQCCIPFISHAIYTQWLIGLSDPVKQAVWLLIWEDHISLPELEICINTKILNKAPDTYPDSHPGVISPAFAFLTNYHAPNASYYSYRETPLMSLPLPIRKTITNYYHQPDHTKLTGSPETPTGVIEYLDSEQTILQEWPRIRAYVNDKQVDFTLSGRPKLTGLPKMQKQLGLRELFPQPENKKFRFLRSYLLAALARVAPTTYPAAPVHQQLKQLFDLPFKKFLPTPTILLLDLKNSANIFMWDKLEKEPLILELLAALPEGEWVNTSQIVGYTKYHFWNINPIHFSTAATLYYEYQHHKEYLEHHHIKDAIELPYIMGSFFLFAAFGLCEICFNEPDTSIPGLTYYSSWDYLFAVRRTKLGDYVCGLSPEYDYAHAKPSYTFTLSPETLMITMENGDDITAKMMEPYAERIAANRFKTDAAYFLKGITSKKNLESKLGLFKQLFPDGIPANWQAFFDGLLLNINPFDVVQQVHVLKLPPDNRELLQLVARDPMLANLIHKAEGHMLIIRHQDLAAFKRRLLEFGYLITL